MIENRETIHKGTSIVIICPAIAKEEIRPLGEIETLYMCKARKEEEHPLYLAFLENKKKEKGMSE